MNAPAYVLAARSGLLKQRLERAREMLVACRLCPRHCGVDRTAGELGYCQAAGTAAVYSHTAHPGEEPPLSGTRGSGTIFFGHCTLSCIYCQNHRFSQEGGGRDTTADELAGMMVALAGSGCHNINLVSPTHYTAAILEALELAVGRGVNIPLVWNTSSYESAEVLALLDGMVDIYLADIRYSDPEAALKYSDAPDYVEVSRAALKEMHRQVGALELDSEGIAVRGLIVRHLVMPNDISGTGEALRFIAHELGADTHVSLMAQYYPAYRAGDCIPLSRRITASEWARALQSHDEAGLTNGWIQDHFEEVPPIAGSKLRPDGS
ncbi:radical SAM protein [bacterium]|nr:radical SAM protein [bacterium]